MTFQKQVQISRNLGYRNSPPTPRSQLSASSGNRTPLQDGE